MIKNFVNKKIFFLVFFIFIFFIFSLQKVGAVCCCYAERENVSLDKKQVCKEVEHCDNGNYNPCFEWAQNNGYKNIFYGHNSVCPEYCKDLASPTSDYVSSPPKAPILSIIIPGLNLTSDPKALRVCSECSESIEDASQCPDEKCAKWTYKIPWLGEYISAFYKWAIGAIAVLAVLMIVVAGFRMVVAGGNAEKVKGARDSLFAAVIGLLFMLIVHQVLAMINPDLVIFKPIIIGSIKRVEIDSFVVNAGADSNGASNSSNACAIEADLVRIDASKFGGVSASDPRLLTQAYQALINAQLLAKKAGKDIYIVSAFRTLAHQQSLWNNAVKKYGSESAAAPYVARPSCGAPHLTGGTVDVCLSGTSSCNQIDGKYAQNSSTDIIALQNFMTQAGFVRYCGEWWHFEYGTKRWEDGKNLPPGPNKCK